MFSRSQPRVEKRQIGLDPRPMSDMLGGLFNRSYQDIDLQTMENSLQVIAMRSSVELLASIASELPIDVYRGEGRDRKQIAMPGYLEDPAGDGYGIEDWISQAMVSWLLRGNLYGDTLERGPSDTLRQVRLFHPDSVTPVMDTNGKLQWTVVGQDVPARDFFHRRVNPVPGRILGLSPVSSHADSIGLAISTTRFGLGWFQGGAHPGGILSNSEADMSDETVSQTAKDRFMAALRGTREPLVLGRGWDYKQIQIAPEESQFLQTQEYSAAECARIFGPGVAEVLGYKTSGSMTYVNMVDRDLSLLKYAANKWLTRIDRLLSQFLPRPQYVRLNRDAFLETNALERWRKHVLSLNSAAVTVNEVREIENYQPVEWGDEPWTKQVVAQSEEPKADPNAQPDSQPEPGAVK